jgi:peptidoglycan/xylan/chitin deacetylase (PgdA/CDA1 family)
VTSPRAVVLSLDAELMWGFHDYEDIPTARVEQARDSWLAVLDMLDNHGVPATWAVVGHLFLDSCDGVHSRHPLGDDWFTRDPGGTETVNSAWFGRDLIDAVRNSRVDHEIGSHSFSHVEFGDDETTAAVARTELEQSVAAAEDFGIDLDSFIFPRNNIGHRRLLPEYGFTCYRGRAPDRWYERTAAGKVGKFATLALGTHGPPVVEPTIDEHGLVNVPASMFLFMLSGPARNLVHRVSGDPIVRQVETGLNRLQHDDSGLLHLWLHPNNITTGKDRQLLDRVIGSIAEFCRDHDVEISTMSQVAQQVRNR